MIVNWKKSKVHPKGNAKEMGAKPWDKYSVSFCDVYAEIQYVGKGRLVTSIVIVGDKMYCGQYKSLSSAKVRTEGKFLKYTKSV